MATNREARINESVKEIDRIAERLERAGKTHLAAILDDASLELTDNLKKKTKKRTASTQRMSAAEIREMKDVAKELKRVGKTAEARKLLKLASEAEAEAAAADDDGEVSEDESGSESADADEDTDGDEGDDEDGDVDASESDDAEPDHEETPAVIEAQIKKLKRTLKRKQAAAEDMDDEGDDEDMDDGEADADEDEDMGSEDASEDMDAGDVDEEPTDPKTARALRSLNRIASALDNDDVEADEDADSESAEMSEEDDAEADEDTDSEPAEMSEEEDDGPALDAEKTAQLRKIARTLKGKGEMKLYRQIRDMLV